MATLKNFVYVNILGITREPQFCMVRINRPLMNISKMKRSKGAFRVSDYIAINEFTYLQQTAKEYIVTSFSTISHDDDFAYLKIESNVPPEIEVGDYWWLRHEKLKIIEIIEVGLPLEATILKVKRGIDNTLKQDIIGTSFVDQRLNNCRFNTLMYEYKISNFVKDYRGLIIELTDNEGRLLGAGVIKSMSVTSGRAVIDCDDLIETVDNSIDKMKYWALTHYTALDDRTLQYVYTFKGLFSLILGFGIERGWSSADSVFRFKDKKSLQIVSTPIYKYIDKESMVEAKTSFTQRLSTLGALSPDDVTSYKDSEDFLTVNTPKSIDILKFVEFISGYFLSWDSNIGKYVFKNIIGITSNFDSSVEDKRRLMPDLSSPKVISTQFEVVKDIVVKWADRDTHFSTADFAGIYGSTSVSFQLFKNWNIENEAEIFEIILDNYLALQGLAVANLKVQIPQRLVEQKYQVGTKFEIQDIEDFYTFQKKGKEVFVYGVVSSTEGDEVNIVVVANLVYAPISPQLTVSYEGDYTSPTGDETWKYKIHNLNELLDIENIEEDSFWGQPYFEIDGEVKLLYVTGILPEAFTATVKGFFQDIIYIEKDTSFTDFDKVEGIIYGEFNTLSDFQKHFFYIGEHRWV